MPILAGRAITPADSLNSLKVVVVSQGLAHHYFPNNDALGHALTIGIDTVKGPWQIVGIAKDTRSGDPHSSHPVQMTYIPLTQIVPFAPVDPSVHPPAPPLENQDRFAGVILLRTTGEPTRSIADLRAAVAAIDPNLPLLNVISIQDQVSSLMTHDELISTLSGLFSLLALLLASIGLYGVMSYNVTRRNNEIGIRFALGAPTQAVLWMILRESIFLLVLGIALGLPITIGATSILRGQLFGLGSIDPITFAVAIAVVCTITLFAAWLPARRATRVDPMVALQCD